MACPAMACWSCRTSFGPPVVPEGKLAPWGLLIVHGLEYVEPPADGPGVGG